VALGTQGALRAHEQQLIRVTDEQRSMSASLTVEGAPQMKVTATLTRIGELP